MNKKIFFILIFVIILMIIIGLLMEIFLIQERKTENKLTVAKEPQDTEIKEKTETIIEVILGETENELKETVIPFIPIVNPKADTYYIKVNNQMNTVTIYIKNKDGEYTVPVKAMICSTGDTTYRNSTYHLTNRRWEWRLLFGDVYGQYTTQIYGDILFHSVPYEKQSKDTLEYWEYDKLGTTCSAGCVRLTVEDAKWIYENCPSGTTVEFYDSEEPGPFGKPSVSSISEYEEYRTWDPTDPDENNPWKEIL